MTTAVADSHRRRTKMSRLRADGIDPFPRYEQRGRHLIAEVLRGDNAPSGDGELVEHRLAGRVVGRRRRGPTTFLQLRDRSGTIGLRMPAEGSLCGSVENYPWDIGDIVTVTGHARSSATGEVGLEVSSGALLAKAMQIHHGLSQVGHVTRLPELSLMQSAEHRRRALARAHAVCAIREWMVAHDFVELETPTLQPSLGGALARPFRTHHNALGRDASLRTSSELYLRRCTVGDLERVFELGRCFRNEGVSTRHSPEFTSLEWSMSYSNYRDSAAQLELMVGDVAEALFGARVVKFRGRRIDLSAPWRRISLRQAIHEHTGFDILDTPAKMLAEPTSNGAPCRSWSEAVHRLYTVEVEPRLNEPCIVYDFPLDTNPCARSHSADGRLAECFDVVVGGLEIASGGTEISDPDEQELRFKEQRQADGAGAELSRGERDYVTALAYGAPPSSGAGVGVDRLLMVLLGLENVGQASLFPALG